MTRDYYDIWVVRGDDQILCVEPAGGIVAQRKLWAGCLGRSINFLAEVEPYKEM